MCRVDEVGISEPHVVFDPVIHVFIASCLFKFHQFHHLPGLDNLTLLPIDDSLNLFENALCCLSDITDLANFKFLYSEQHPVLRFVLSKPYDSFSIVHGIVNVLQVPGITRHIKQLVMLRRSESDVTCVVKV